MIAAESDVEGEGAAEPTSPNVWQRCLARSVPGTQAVRDLRYRYRGVERSLARFPPARLLTVVPRAGGYAYRTALRQRSDDRPAGLPTTRLTPSLLANVAMDEALVTLVSAPDRLPHRADLERVGREVRDAAELFDAEGWLDDPVGYHEAPPPLDGVQVTSGWAFGEAYDRIWFPSDYEPHAGEPGRDRWLGYHTNRTASAWVLRHADDDVRPRPWLVCVHGFGMGQAFMDFPAFRVRHLHHELGLNVIGPVLPLHGHRKVGRLGGDEFLGYDLLNAVHGLTQAVWDIRRVLSWVRAQPGGEKVGVYGISLGAFTSSILAAVEGDLAAVIAGIPVSDFPALYAAQSPPIIRDRSVDAGVLGGPGERIHRVVTPLAMPVAVPKDRRFIFAGLADRMSHPRQAHHLWRHWDEPPLRWYPGNHVGYLWSDRVNRFLDESLAARGLVFDVPGRSDRDRSS